MIQAILLKVCILITDNTQNILQACASRVANYTQRIPQYGLWYILKSLQYKL